jgi:hypothetical protein
MTASSVSVRACVALDGFHQVRDEVVAAGELNVDLRERILVSIACINQSVVEETTNQIATTTTASSIQPMMGLLIRARGA